MPSESKGPTGQEQQHPPGLSNPAPHSVAASRTSQGHGPGHLPLALSAGDFLLDLGFLPSSVLAGPSV
jgi:hypothetical protein